MASGTQRRQRERVLAWLRKGRERLDASGAFRRMAPGVVDLAVKVLRGRSGAELVEARRELAESEARFAEVFRRAPDVMSIVRVSDAVMYEVNDAFEKVSGLSREQLIGKSSYDFPWWPSIAVRDHVLGTLHRQGYLQDEEVRFAPDTGGEVVSVISASPILFCGEQCVVWRANDVTAWRRAEQAKRNLEERLLQKQNLERLGLLAGGIAHDFNNLLVGVLGNADLLLGMVDETSHLAAPLRTIVTGTQRMAEHTRELLDYAGHTAVRLAPVQLDSLLDEVVQLARPLVKAALELQIHCASPDPVWIRGDAGQLTRLFVNLIKNAAEALDGQHGVIVMSLEAGRQHADVRVVDSGHGMDASTRASIFDPFFSTKLKGYGLGLASAPSIIERHAGSISVESVVGRGTTVAVRLPRYLPSLSEPVSPVPAALPRNKGRVLVVDDEPEVRRVARAMLMRLGFEAIEAEDGMSALRLVELEPEGCVLVLLDATMPGLNGAQTFERLRVLNARLPVLLCSGYSHVDFSELLAVQPRTSFLTKPFRAEQLANAIAMLLESERAA